MQQNIKRKTVITIIGVVLLGSMAFFINNYLANQRDITAENTKAAVANSNNINAGKKIWFEDGNRGEAGAVPYDFTEQFTNPSKWEEVLQKMDVYMIRNVVLTNITSNNNYDFLRQYLLPTLKKYNIELALDTGAATWAKCYNRKAIVDRDIELVEKIHSLSENKVKVSYISLQSVLNKPLPFGAGQCNYSLDDRLDDVAYYVTRLKARFPTIKIGIIDSMVAQQQDWKTVFEALRGRNIALDYIHFDHPYERGNFTGLLEANNYVRDEMNLRTGIFITSKRGPNDGGQPEDLLTAAPSEFMEIKNAGIVPGDFLIGSWVTYPQYTLKDNSPYSMQSVANTLFDLVMDSYKTLKVVKIKGNLGEIAIQEHRIFGWAYNVNKPLMPLQVRIFIDGDNQSGQLLGTYDVDVRREDVNVTFSIAGSHGFNEEIPQKYYNNKDHTFYVYVYHQGRYFDIAGSPKTVNLRS